MSHSTPATRMSLEVHRTEPRGPILPGTWHLPKQDEQWDPTWVSVGRGRLGWQEDRERRVLFMAELACPVHHMASPRLSASGHPDRGLPKTPGFRVLNLPPWNLEGVWASSRGSGLQGIEWFCQESVNSTRTNGYKEQFLFSGVLSCTHDSP